MARQEFSKVITSPHSPSVEIKVSTYGEILLDDWTINGILEYHVFILVEFGPSNSS